MIYNIRLSKGLIIDVLNIKFSVLLLHNLKKKKNYFKKLFYLDRGGNHPGNQHCKEKKEQQFHSKKKLWLKKISQQTDFFLCIKHSKLIKN